jgi:hypothetical protein
MKKIIYLFSITFLILQSCSSGDVSNPVIEIPDLIKPPYTVKYEIIFPQNAWSSRTTSVSCAYENSNGNWLPIGAQGTLFYIQNNNLNQGFTKTFTVTDARNPLGLHLSTNYNPAVTSSLIFKIYVNNVLVEQATRIFNPYTGIDSYSGLQYSVY